MREELTTMVLPFKIKLKKGHTKNTFVHLCSISEVIKPTSKMTLLYPKIEAMLNGVLFLTTNNSNCLVSYYVL